MMTEDMTRTLNDPSASYWLKKTMLEAMRRDPVDSAKDAEVLAALLRARAEAMMRGDRVNHLYVASGPFTE